MALILVLLFSLLIRLRGFTSHFTLSSDTARDLLVAHGAIILNKIPWVGSFSSAGPFVFGPNWYWWLMFWRLITPNFFLAPWVGMLLLSVSFVLVMYLVGKIAVDKKFGLILALLTGVSSQVVALSAYLTQHAMIGIFSGLALLGVVGFVRSRRLPYVFLTSLSIGAALSMHYQAINLLVYLPILFLQEKPTLKRWVLIGLISFLGLLIFLWPLFLWDSTRSFQNLTQLLYYFRVGQYRFWVSNRWLTYLGVFWPDYLAKFSGEKVVAILLVLSGGFLTLKQFVKGKLPKTIIWPLIIFGAQIFLLRYFRGEKYGGYLVYLHPVIILTIGWFLHNLLKINRWLGFSMFILILVFNMKLNNPVLDWDNDAGKLKTMISEVSKIYPNSKFTVYARGLSSSNCAYSFSALVQGENKGDSFGAPLGICQNGLDDCGQPGAIKIAKTIFQNESCGLVDLTKINKSSLTKKNDWYNFSAIAVYDDVQNWWR